MHELAIEKNIRFLVVLLPTKEAVFRNHWADPSTSYRSLMENEERFRTIATDFLVKNGIEYLDSLPTLQQQLTKGIRPYRVSHDGHPNEIGQRTIAKLVAAYLESSMTD